MIPPSLQAIGIASIAAFLIGASSTWYFTATYKDARWSAQVEAARAEAAELVQRETASTIKKEREARLLLNTLEVQHETVRQSLDHVSRENRRLVAQLGGLRDPGAASRRSAVSNSTAETGHDAGTTDTGARLSAEAEEFLLTFAEDADRAAHYAATCKAWSDVVAGDAVAPTPTE